VAGGSAGRIQQERDDERNQQERRPVDLRGNDRDDPVEGVGGQRERQDPGKTALPAREVARRSSLVAFDPGRRY
jgi:hypothetical protein